MPTIGVAIALPEPWATQLQDYRSCIGDATAEQIPTHITLVPPATIELDQMYAVHQHLQGVAARVQPFRIHLRGTGTFRPVSPVVFVAVAEGIGGCEQLAEEVRSGPLDVPLRFPFHPHVTVAHHLPDEVMDRAFAELAKFDCAFACAGFSLYVHDPAKGWEPVQHYRLDSTDFNEAGVTFTPSPASPVPKPPGS